MAMLSKILAGVLFVSPTISQASWLSDTLEGHPPPLRDVGPCAISPGLCAANEAKKAEERRRAVEEENRQLREALSRNRSQLSDLILQVDIKSEDERTEIRQALSSGES